MGNFEEIMVLWALSSSLGPPGPYAGLRWGQGPIGWPTDASASRAEQARLGGWAGLGLAWLGLGLAS